MIPARVVLKNVAEADLAFFAEVGARRSSGGVYGDEARILRGFKDAAMAGLVFGARGVEPSGNAAIDETVAIVAIEVDFGVVGPALFTSFRIERDDAVERGGEVESAVNEKGSGLETAALSSAAGLGSVASVKGPGDSKCGHVVATDLGERGVAHSTGVVAIVGPGIATESVGWSGSRGPGEKHTCRKQSGDT